MGAFDRVWKGVGVPSCRLDLLSVERRRFLRREGIRTVLLGLLALTLASGLAVIACSPVPPVGKTGRVLLLAPVVLVFTLSTRWLRLPTTRTLIDDMTSVPGQVAPLRDAEIMLLTEVTCLIESVLLVVGISLWGALEGVAPVYAVLWACDGLISVATLPAIAVLFGDPGLPVWFAALFYGMLAINFSGLVIIPPVRDLDLLMTVFVMILSWISKIAFAFMGIAKIDEGARDTP